MSARDEISKAAENAMEDLAGTSERSDDAHVPEPGKPGEPIKVNSSISEATNASEAEREGAAAGGSSAGRTPSDAGKNRSQIQQPSSDDLESRDADGEPGREGALAEAAAGSVPGPAGLPDPDPEDGTSDPLESEEDPSTGMGRA